MLIRTSLRFLARVGRLVLENPQIRKRACVVLSLTRILLVARLGRERPSSASRNLMAIPITCPGCQATFEVPEGLAGQNHSLHVLQDAV